MTEPDPDAPFLLIIAGPNGAGKSSHWNREFRSRKLRIPYVNADEIAQGMPPSETRDRNAMLEAERRRREHIERRESFAFETVFSHPGKLEEIRLAKKAGFHIRLVFIGLANPQLSMARVRRRVALGGHSVPLDRIPGRYTRDLENLVKAIPAIDEAVVWDNSAEDQAPTVLVEFKNGKVTTRAPSLPAWIKKALGPLLDEPKPKKSKPAPRPKPALRRLR
jgi:predicted ABC-type ATPase